MDYIISLLSFLKEKKGRIKTNNSTVHVTFQLHQTSKYSTNTDSKLWSTYHVVTLYIKGTVKELSLTTQSKMLFNINNGTFLHLQEIEKHRF